MNFFCRFLQQTGSIALKKKYSCLVGIGLSQDHWTMDISTFCKPFNQSQYSVKTKSASCTAIACKICRRSKFPSYQHYKSATERWNVQKVGNSQLWKSRVYVLEYNNHLIDNTPLNFIYSKVASSRLSRLVTHFQIFKRLMKGKIDADVLWTLDKKFQN